MGHVQDVRQKKKFYLFLYDCLCSVTVVYNFEHFSFFVILSSLVMAYMVLKFVCASSPADTQVYSRACYFYLRCLCLCPLC